MKTKRNIVTEGFSGRILQVVFSQRNGKTIVGSRPERTGQLPLAQQQVIATFKQAVIYAKAILSDAANKLAYQLKAKPGQSAFNLAIADFFKAPLIGELDTSGYNGQVGSTVIAMVTDDFKVSSVRARIEKSTGDLLEEGDASLLPDGLTWMYVATAGNSNLAGTKVSYIAKDQPGHSTIKSKTL